MLKRSKFIIAVDILVFLISAYLSINFMIRVMLNIGTHVLSPAIIFVFVYMTNLLFYRICTEIGIYKLTQNNFIHILMCVFTIAVEVCTLLLVIYLAFMAIGALHDCTLYEVLTNHITYASIVGSSLVLHLASDNMTILFNIYLKM